MHYQNIPLYYAMPYKIPPPYMPRLLRHIFIAATLIDASIIVIMPLMPLSSVFKARYAMRA